MFRHLESNPLFFHPSDRFVVASQPVTCHTGIIIGSQIIRAKNKLLRDPLQTHFVIQRWITREPARDGLNYIGYVFPLLLNRITIPKAGTTSRARTEEHDERENQLTHLHDACMIAGFITCSKPRQAISTIGPIPARQSALFP